MDCTEDFISIILLNGALHGHQQTFGLTQINAKQIAEKLFIPTNGFPGLAP